MRKMLAAFAAFAVFAGTLAYGADVLPKIGSDNGPVEATPVVVFDASGNAVAGTGSVNVSQVGGATVATGHGTAAGALRVELPTDGTGTVAITGTPAVTQSGVWTVQPGNTANTTAWKVDGSAVTQPVTLGAATTGGCTPTGVQSAASTNSINVKASAGTWCGGKAINTTGTIYYLRLYDLATAPTCSSATGFIATLPIPASASGAGTDLGLGPFGAAFAAGIGFCLTGGGTSTDNTSAATGVYLTITYK